MWVSFSNEFLVFPCGFLRSIVLPQHSNLGNNPFPQPHFSPVENAQWLDQDLSFRFDLQPSTISVIYFQNTFPTSSIEINSYPYILPFDHMLRVINILLKHGYMENIMNSNVAW